MESSFGKCKVVDKNGIDLTWSKKTKVETADTFVNKNKKWIYKCMFLDVVVQFLDELSENAP